jgi:hypothetical protein
MTARLYSSSDKFEAEGLLEYRFGERSLVCSP